MSYENRRRKSHESPEIDDETRQQLFAARDLIDPIEATLERYYAAADDATQQEAFVYCRSLVWQLRSEYDDLTTKIDVDDGETGYILVMLLIKACLADSEPVVVLPG